MVVIITGRPVGAEEALRIGLANEVVPAGKALERALELAHEIADLPQGAIRSDKETMVRNVGRTYEEQLRREAENCLSMFARQDSHAVGARAFKEGREPECSGRDNLKSLAMTVATVKSVEEGRWVEMAEVLG